MTIYILVGCAVALIIILVGWKIDYETERGVGFKREKE